MYFSQYKPVLHPFMHFNEEVQAFSSIFKYLENINIDKH